MLSLQGFGVTRCEAVLSNGLKLVVFERPNTPVAIRVLTFAGSRFDPADKQGLAHFVEHMVANGTKKFPTKDKMAAYIEQCGGEYGANTGIDILTINAGIGDPDDVNVLLDILHEILLEPLFDEKAIGIERGVILDELRKKKANPESMIWDVWKRTFFQGTDAERSGLGTEKSIQSITKQDLVNFYRTMFTSGRMVIVASGGITIKELQQEIEKQLPVSRSDKFVVSRDLPIIRHNPISIESYIGKEQVRLIFGFRTVALTHADFPRLVVLAGILGNGRTSALYKRLRIERGLVYEEYIVHEAMSDCGTFAVETATAKKNVQEVLDILCQEMKHIVENGVTEEQIQLVKNRIIKSRRMKMQTSDSWVAFHADEELFRASPWTLADYLEEIESVTPQDVQRVAQKYFGKDKWYLVMCGDIANDDVEIHW